MEAKIDPYICIGCSLCTQVCPEVFRMKGEKVFSFTSVVPKEDEDAYRQAAYECPVNAIMIK